MEVEVPERVRHYLIHGLSATPKTMSALLEGVSETELDARPDPERFTLREVVAHMADWDTVWLERLSRIADEDQPFLPGYDEGQWAIDHDYAHTDTAQQLALLAGRRAKMLDFIRSQRPDVWRRTGMHGELGAVSFLELTSLFLGHDGYHIKQILDYRGLGGLTKA